MRFEGFFEYTSASIRKISKNTTLFWQMEKKLACFQQVVVVGENAFAKQKPHKTLSRK